MNPYDAIARLYDPWSRSVTEDVPFYVAEARRAGGPVVELGVGTGRIAVPIAAEGIRVIGVDASPGMLEVCRERADWDERARTLTLAVRGPQGEGTMSLAWISPAEWHELLERAGFRVEACYGWFDRSPYRGGEDTVWIARRP